MGAALNLSHLSIADWIIIAATSGFAAAVFNQVFGGLLGLFQKSREYRHQQRLQTSQHDFQVQMQKDARENESLQLLIKDHFTQRTALLEPAINTYEWLWNEYYEHYGIDHEVYDNVGPTPVFDSVNEVITALKLIAHQHPTRSIRRMANNLESSIAMHYSSITGYEKVEAGYQNPVIGGQPSEERLERWLTESQELIEQIHTPPRLSDVQTEPSASSDDAAQLLQP